MNLPCLIPCFHTRIAASSRCTREQARLPDPMIGVAFGWPNLSRIDPRGRAMRLAANFGTSLGDCGASRPRLLISSRKTCWALSVRSPKSSASSYSSSSLSLAVVLPEPSPFFDRVDLHGREYSLFALPEMRENRVARRHEPGSKRGVSVARCGIARRECRSFGSAEERFAQDDRLFWRLWMTAAIGVFRTTALIQQTFDPGA